MKVKIKKVDLLDIIILYWMMIYVFIISWLAYINQGAMILVLLIAIRFMMDFKHVCKLKSIYVGLLFCTIYPLWNFYDKGGTYVVLNSNISTIVTNTLMFIYCLYLCKYKKDFVYDFFIKNKNIFNGYMIINLPVLVLQLMGNTALSGRHPESLSNAYSADLISGLFGYNGTGLLTMYFCFLIVYNYFLLKGKQIKHVKLFILYNFLTIGFMFYVALKSDNKGLFFLIPLCLCVYIIINKLDLSKNFLKKIKKIVSYIFIIASVLIFGVIISQPFFNSIYFFQLALQSIKKNWLLLDNSYGSMERFGMIAYALSKEEIRWSGYGIGMYMWKTSKAMNFEHFGICDLGTFMCLGGLAFVLLLMLLVWSVYYSMFSDKIVAFILLILTAIILFYTQLFTVTSLMCSWVFWVLIVYIGSDIVNNKQLCRN